MAIYWISAKPDKTEFNVVIEDSDGRYQTTLSFSSEAAAKAWVAHADRLTRPRRLPKDDRRRW
jgi:hypothetical protein